MSDLDWIPETNRDKDGNLLGPDMVSQIGISQRKLQELRSDPESGLIYKRHWVKKTRKIYYNKHKMNEWIAAAN